MPFHASGAAFLVFVIVSVSFFGMTETPGIKNYVLPKLYNCKGNLKARWYIEFQAMNVETGKLELKRIACPAKFETKKQREVWGKENCKAITALLEKGFSFGNAPDIKEVDTTPSVLTNDLESTITILTSTHRGKTANTYGSAVNKLKAFIQWTNEVESQNHSVQKISVTISSEKFTNRFCVIFRDYLVTELKNSPRTANNTVHHLNTVYKHMQLRKNVPDSPFKLKKLKQEVTTKNIAFTDDDRKVIEKHLIEHEPELYLFTRLIYYAFIRPGELHQLRLYDIRIPENYIIVRGAISKNGKTETVQMIPRLADEMKKLNLQDKKDFYYLFGKGLVPSRFISGKQVAFRRHEKILKALGMSDRGYTLYSWKHTGAVNAYRAGVGVKELQKLLRHSSVSITDIYLKSLGLRTDPNISNYNW